MARASYVFDRKRGKLVPKAEFYATRPRRQRSDLPSPMLIRDFQDGVRSMADGRTYTSRRHWRDHLKAHGMVELGNDRPEAPRPEPVMTEAAVAEAYQMYEQGAGVRKEPQAPDGWSDVEVMLPSVSVPASKDTP